MVLVVNNYFLMEEINRLLFKLTRILSDSAGGSDSSSASVKMKTVMLLTPQ